MYHYLQLLTKRPRKVFFNEFTVEVPVAALSAKKITAFRNFYKIDDTAPLPLSFAFIAGFKAMMKALAHKQFAFAPLGMIHLAAEFKALADIDYQRPFLVEVKVKQNRRHPMGKLVQLESRFIQDEQVCIINTNTMLKKLKASNTKTLAKGLQCFVEPTSMHVDEKLARAYAKISYDYNPIHISNHLAKLFGLPGTIMHGMYFAHLLLHNNKIDSQRVKFEFKKPCLLPTDIGFANNDGQYQIFSGCDDLHLTMRVFDEIKSKDIAA
ncbi:MaoC/PaaZ C-terminal domain-containing protein [Thalassotalea maritima]|uniref:MaoC/PaaZ C-terminal domain-containing protein n=1 Tax=Thalassotalea maritima TaxID=3242416 RepID=UPI0035272ACB